jgi:hypothetical protein
MKRLLRRRKKKQPRDPETPAEWQEAVDAAEFFLRLDSGRQYGVLTGGPKVNCDRAVRILERGKARGYFPAPTDQLTQKFLKFLEVA